MKFVIDVRLARFEHFDVLEWVLQTIYLSLSLLFFLCYNGYNLLSLNLSLVPVL